MNILIEKLNIELNKYNLGCVVKKETLTKFNCYLFDLNEYKIINGNVKDFSNCKKLDVIYKKEELYKLIENKKLNNFCKRERINFDYAKKLNMLR